MLKHWDSDSYDSPAPNMPFKVMGDIHGCVYLLARTLDSYEVPQTDAATQMRDALRAAMGMTLRPRTAQP